MVSIEPGKTQSFEEVQGDIEKKIRHLGNLKKREDFVERLKKRFPVKIFLPKRLNSEDLTLHPNKSRGSEDGTLRRGKIQDVSPNKKKPAGEKKQKPR